MPTDPHSDPCRPTGAFTPYSDADFDGPQNFFLLTTGVVLSLGAASFLLHHLRRRHMARRPSADGRRFDAAGAAAVREWLASDPDPASRAAVRALAAERGSAAYLELVEARLADGARVRFGTAGLRARMGPGFDRMNARVVACATEAVASVLVKEFGAAKVRERGVAVGFDGRTGSRIFAVAAAEVFVAAGVPVRLFGREVATPVVAFSVREFGLVAAVCVTASHNPKEDNGYKVFWEDGAQIRPRQAELIEGCMRRVPEGRCELDEVRLRELALVTDPTEACVDRYVEEGAKLRWRSVEENAACPPVVYTAMHGVGFPFINRMFQAFGLPPVTPVEEQSLQPDPEFSTVAKPNPEEKGALDMAIARAKSCQADLVLANDPDADRLGVACMDGGAFRILSGNEIAILLADYLLARYPGQEERGNLAMVRSTVSSGMLSAMGRAEGFTVKETLTGFKWLSVAALDFVATGKNCVLAYEEALGYMIGCGVCDKDGVTAAAVFAELAGFWAAQGISVAERLYQLQEKYGFHLTNNNYLRLGSQTTPLESVFDAARERGMPTSLGKCKVVGVRDLTRGTDSMQPDNMATLPKDDGTQFLTFTCRSPLIEDDASAADDVVISLRGSGTEPKMKWYSEIRVASAALCDEGRRILKSSVKDALEQVLLPRKNKFDT